MGEFYQLLDETRGVSLVTLEGHRCTKDGGVELLEAEWPEALLDGKTRDSFLAVHFTQLQETMIQAIEALPDKEKLLISLYYYEELTMKEIGEIMGYTESRVSQLHTQAMLRLRHSLRPGYQDLAVS